jgi:hypothetical protein
MADQSQAARKQKEARTVTWIGRVIGISGLGMTGVLSAAAAIQGPDTLLFQPAHVVKAANYETSPPSVTEVVVDVPVPSPLPPTHVPAGGGTVGGGYVGGSAGAPPASVVHAGVAKPPPLPVPAPTAVSAGSVPH